MDGGHSLTEAKTTVDSAAIQDVLRYLPHRYPFLMIDKVIEIDGDNFGIGIKNVTINEPQFQGHFPSEPVMPGVLLIEGMAQTAGVLCVVSQNEERPSLVYFMTIDKAKFRKPVVPGDVVHYRMTKERQRGNVWRFHGVAEVSGVTVAEADVSAMIVRD
ncbi:MAG: 3-hydroxyacyl-ACP dehydratase FabZ [Pseudomonadota bacterium]